jgi:hypothetical protein
MYYLSLFLSFEIFHNFNNSLALLKFAPWQKLTLAADLLIHSLKLFIEHICMCGTVLSTGYEEEA